MAIEHKKKPQLGIEEQLTHILPEVLPKSPEESLMGSELLALVQPRIQGYSVATIRQAMSVMAHKQDSVIAKKTGSHGYYLRAGGNSEPGLKQGTKPLGYPAPETDGNSETARDEQREEKFRSLFIRLEELESRFPIKIEHTEAFKGKAGQNRWKYPDVVVLEWDTGVRESAPNKNDIFLLKKDLLEVKRALGEQPFKVTSVELKVAVSLVSLRQIFFQCVSNSRWAHSAQLAIAFPISDELLDAELRRLGASFGVSIVTYNMSEESLDALPSADKILDMDSASLESHASKIQTRIVSPGKDNAGLDWEHLGDLKAQHSMFEKLFAWIAKCLSDGKAYSYAQCEAILD